MGKALYTTNSIYGIFNDNNTGSYICTCRTSMGGLTLWKYFIKPGVSAYTMGTFSHTNGIHANDGDHALKLYDTIAPTREDGRPVSEIVHTHHNWDTGSIGNVYGLAIDRHRNIFATALTYYGSYFGFESNNEAKITFGSIGVGVATDTAGNDNNLGSLNDLGAAGTIYKLDAVTGNASIFAQLPQTVHNFTQRGCESNANAVVRNTGPGLGNIEYDKVHDQFFVSNFEDGKIYRLDANGAILNSFQAAGNIYLVPPLLYLYIPQHLIYKKISTS